MTKPSEGAPSTLDLLKMINSLTKRVEELERGYKMDHIKFGAPFHPADTGEFKE